VSGLNFGPTRPIVHLTQQTLFPGVNLLERDTGCSSPFTLGLHESTKCVRCNERHDIAVEIERNPKIKARHDVRQEGRACLICCDLLISFYFYSNVIALVTTDAFCARVAQALVRSLRMRRTVPQFHLYTFAVIH
jgi:hypothetical protein